MIELLRGCAARTFLLSLAASQILAQGAAPDPTTESLRAAASHVVYRLEPSGRAGYRGFNPAQRLSMQFDGRAARLLHPQGNVAVRLAGYGYGDRLRAPMTVQPVGEGNRVEYRRAGLTEWYANEAGGLEQGFTLERRPGTPRAGEALVIALAVEGELHPVLSDGGDAVLLESADGAALRYGGLRSWDARGRPLAARLETRGREIRLVVDDRNAEYPLVMDPLFTQQQELTASDGAAHDQFGISVAVSGNTAVVGAYGHNNLQGAAYVFVLSGGVWTLQQELTASDGVALDEFGVSVSLSGNTIVVGADQKEIGSNPEQGAAYVFVRSGTTWTQQQELTASDGAIGDSFGNSVSVSGNSLIAGANGKEVGENGEQGAAYVFTLSGAIWTQQQELTASDGAAGDEFGSSVALDGSTAVIGAPFHNSPGAAYVFVSSAGSWTQQQELTASDGGSLHFGSSVTVSGGTVVVGEPAKSHSLGAAYVFVSSGATWTQQQELTASDGVAADQFGFSVSLSGNTVIIGAEGKKIGSNFGQGAAYVFTRSGATWTQQQELTASDGAASDSFGASAGVSGNTAVIGANMKQIGSNSVQGAAYVFTAPQTATQFAVSAPASATSGTAFNFTVTALDGNNSTVTGYAGTVHFSSTDSAATLPANATLTNGTGTFSATLLTNGNQTITATDTVTSSITGTSGAIAVSGSHSGSSMAANTGTTPQQTTAGSAFPNALAVTVTNASHSPLSGVSVTFTAPSSGPSGAFQGSGATFTTSTNASGVATAPSFTANTTAGSYTVTATTTGLSTVNFSLTNTAVVGAGRTFVSTTGNDSNNCSASAPCRTFNAALSVTAAGGEIVVLSSGGYGPASISQPVVITADDIVASISTTAAGANGLTINTSGNVTLSGLSLHGEAIGGDGILINQVGILRLYGAWIENFTGDGIHFTSGGELSVYDSKINDNGHDGVLLQSPSANAYVHASGFDGNKNTGVEVTAGQAVIADSSAHYNLTAFLADGGTVTLYNDRAIFNGTALASSSGGQLYFAGCLISHNTTAYSVGSGSTMSGSSPGSSLITPGQGTVGTLTTPITAK